MTIRVVVADDQQLVRAGFRLVLGTEPDIEVVGEAADGADSVRVADVTEPDLVLMDIRMPEVDGLEATRRIVRRGAESPRVVILTTFDDDAYVFAALDAGASGFLLKNSPPERLIDAIRVVARGDALLDPAVTRQVIAEFARRPGRAPPSTAPPELATLTSRERDVLVELARGRTNAEIGARLFVSEATVKTHVSRVLTKLALRDRVHAVIYAYEHGLVTPAE